MAATADWPPCAGESDDVVSHREGTVAIDAGYLIVVHDDWGRLRFPLQEVTVVESQFIGRLALTVGPEDAQAFTLRCCEPAAAVHSLVAAVELAKTATSG